MTTGVVDFHHGFDVGFSERETTGQTTEGAYPYPVAINGRGYVIDLKKYQRQTLPQTRQAQDTSQEPGEQSLSIEGVWKRTGTAAIHGAGQEFYDDEDSDRSRFWRSRGIDPWKRREIKLLHGTSRVRTSASADQLLLVVGDHLLVTDGQNVYYSTDPLAGSFTDQGIGSGQPISSLATNGSLVFAACGSSGIRQFTPGGGAGSVLVNGATFPATLIGYANGWLVAGADYRLQSVAASGTLTPIGDHRNTAFVWKAVTSAPNAIYVAGNAGDRAEIHRIVVSDDGSQLNPPIFAGDLPAGETINTLSFYSGTMLLGTSKGLRIALIGGDGGLAIGPVIEDTSGQGVACFEARGQYAWFGHVNDYDANRRGLARADLARYTEDGVPAWAPDLSSTVVAGRTASVCTWRANGREYRLFTVDGSGLWAESDDLVAEGAIDFGWLGQSSPERKTLQSFSVMHDPLEGEIQMIAENEQGATSEGVSATQASVTSGEIAGGVAGELLRFTLVLTRSELDTEAGPVIRRWTIRVIPAPASVDEIVVPLLLADSTRDSQPSGKFFYDTYEEFFRLKELESARTVVTYREGKVSYDVTIRGVQIQGAESWSRERGFFEATIYVRMITLDGIPPRVGGI